MAMRYLFAFCLGLASSALAEEADVPHVFEAGEPARASEVNDNFNALSEALQEALSRIENVETTIDGQSAELDRQAQQIADIQRQLPIVLDLSEPPVTIDQPGRYVLDQNWSVGVGYEMAGITISADSVDLDMRGYRIGGDGFFPGLSISGDNVSIANGLFQSAPVVVEEESVRVVFDAVEFNNSGGGSPLILNGGTAVVSNSWAVGLAGVFVGGGRHQLRNVSMRGQEGHALIVRGGSIHLSDSQLDARYNTVLVETNGNTFERNTLSMQADGYGIDLQGDHNNILDNRFPGGEGTAIHVRGSANLLRGNTATPRIPEPGAYVLWYVGIEFSADGNMYGSNVMAAETPFELGSTTQIDLGGNQGFIEPD